MVLPQKANTRNQRVRFGMQPPWDLEAEHTCSASNFQKWACLTTAHVEAIAINKPCKCISCWFHSRHKTISCPPDSDACRICTLRFERPKSL